MKPREIPPQVGFNNNVKHRGVVFHIQTEDSGVHRPHVTTHLFVDGGRIVKSQRTDYGHLLTAADLPTELRSLMKEQHKAMFRALRGGVFDAMLEDLFGTALDEPPRSRLPVELSGSLSAAELDLEAEPNAERTAPMNAVPRGTHHVSRAPVSAASPSSATPTMPSPEQVTPFSLPPPVVVVTPPSGGAQVLSFPPSSRTDSVAPGDARERASIPASSSRSRAPRPAAIFVTHSDSLFGGDAKHESSIDDVILSYLAGESDVEKR